jgi:hypothetical protein
MKFLVLIGGSLGFTVVIAGGWLVGRDPLSNLVEASFGCLIGAVLFRWFGNLYLQSVQTVIREREAASRERTPESQAETVSSTQS